MPDTDPSPTTDTTERPLATVLDRVVEPDPDAESMVSVDDLLARLGSRSFNTLMLVPAVLIVTPLSAIPGVSSLCGILIASAAIQNLLGRDHIYLPRWICRRSVSEQRLTNAIERVRRPVRWLDRQTRPRLEALVQPPFSRIVSVGLRRRSVGSISSATSRRIQSSTSDVEGFFFRPATSRIS